MSAALTIAALQRQASLAEAERLRLVDALETERLRAAAAEARIASVSGVTREQLVAVEREACAVLAWDSSPPEDRDLWGFEIAAAIRARGAR